MEKLKGKLVNLDHPEDLCRTALMYFMAKAATLWNDPSSVWVYIPSEDDKIMKVIYGKTKSLVAAAARAECS